MFLSVLLGAGILLLGILIGWSLATASIKQMVESANKNYNTKRGE